MKKIISIVLSIAVLISILAVSAFAEGDTWHLTIEYTVESDPYYGSPTVLNMPETQKPEAGEEFILAENLKTDSILGTNIKTGEMYIGQWVFSGWTVPDFITTREEVEEPDELYNEAYSEIIEEKETKIICVSSYNADITGSWEFLPEELLEVPEKIEIEDLPLSGYYDALDSFWPEREARLNEVYTTGLFPESFIKYMNENIKEIPVQDKEFSSVALSETELSTFMSAVKETYEALTSENSDSAKIRAAIQDIVTSTDSENAKFSTAFIAYCAEKAGLLEGKSRSMIKTADINELYDFLANDACADIITVDDLLQIYDSEDGELTDTIIVNNVEISFAHDESWYDVSNSKNTIQPGDLIIFINAHDEPVSAGIIDSVDGRDITFVMCVNSDTPTEYTLDEEYIETLGKTKTKAEIVGLRSCDSTRIVYEFLVNEMDLPEASALGIMGNIYYESKFSTTSLGDGNTSFGLCQWHNDRFINLVIFCMKNNYNIASLEGQLKYLEYELEGNYQGLLIEFRKTGTSTSWARETAYRFCQLFEQPAEIELNAALRGNIASGTMWDSYSELFLSPKRLTNMKLSQGTMQQTTGAQSEYIVYTVKNGDTLAGICKTLGVDYSRYGQEVMAMNKISNENVIYAGQTLTFLSSMLN